VILYLEVPNFYATLERARSPDLRDRPVIVGGDPRKRGLVQSASPDAQAAGVVSGMVMQEAIARCPTARGVKTDMQYYREVSRRLRGCLRSEVGALQPEALGSACLDVALFDETPEDVGRRIRTRVQDDLELPLRIGVATVKFLARLAAEQAGDGGLLRIPPGAERSFLEPLSVECLPGVGPKTAGRLRLLGAETIGHLQRLGRRELEDALGNHGLRILELAHGREDAVVRGQSHPRSLSREHTFSEPQLDLGELWECLQRLSQLLGEGLQEQGLCARRIAVKVRFEDQQVTTRSRTSQTPIENGAEIYPAALGLLERTAAGTRGVRLLGIRVAGLGPRPRDTQLELFTE
jgi:DNA polymerase-4